MNSNLDEISYARLSVQRALLGEVSARVRAVACFVRSGELEVKIYIDGNISEEDLESASCVETEIIADYGENNEIRVVCVRADVPSLVGDTGHLVYKRKE